MSIKSSSELGALKSVGRIVALTLQEMEGCVAPGVSTAELDRIGALTLAKYGARSAPPMVYGFLAAICISVNDEAVHGIPNARMVQPGDLVKLNVAAEMNGYMADAARTVPVPPVSEEARALTNCAKTAFLKALALARAGRRLWEIGMAIETEVKRCEFSVIRELCGHGIGKTIHEAPQVPNYSDRAIRGRLSEGLVITLEPIIAAGSGKPVLNREGWTISTSDGRLAAHYEQTIVVTRDAPILLTEAA